jgi:enamine deaminase RidA (YjgF/YER057c/UK114 family)
MIDEQPIPQGLYLPASRYADLIYTSGMTPRIKGELQHVGQIKIDTPMELYRPAVELAISNALVAAEGLVRDNEYTFKVLQLNVFINAEKGFASHAALADFASEKIADKYGPQSVGSRAAIGVASLPGDAPVEITLTAAVSKK